MRIGHAMIQSSTAGGRRSQNRDRDRRSPASMVTPVIKARPPTASGRYAPPRVYATFMQEAGGFMRDEADASASQAGPGRRDEILREAALLFLESGYRGTSMGTIADRVGIAKPTLYHYWRSKEDILYEIHKQ